VTTIAYLANSFPVEVEPYVGEEIHALRRCGVNVIATSVRRPKEEFARRTPPQEEILYLLPVSLPLLTRAFTLLIREREQVAGVFARILFRGRESFVQRLKALLHTWLGACYAVRLQNIEVDHIHVHHGYFGSWIAMIATRLLKISYSLTLHGSDLLIDGVYLDVKLKHCSSCKTVSAYNRDYILRHFPEVDPEKIKVLRLGVDLPEVLHPAPWPVLKPSSTLLLLSVGRLHPVKNHEFLVRCCARLRDLGVDFECKVAGDGPEKCSLESKIRAAGLAGRITLLGHVSHTKIDELYAEADLVVLTSRSEGIPLVLMEAMARGKFVLAPVITGIPELVVPGKTGFLYASGMVEDFVKKVVFISQFMRGKTNCAAIARSDWIRHAAYLQVLHNFNRQKNLANLSHYFLQLTAA
jgi:colanic acid/amylovoran biosynthesis glycosyltransferase